MKAIVIVPGEKALLLMGLILSCQPFDKLRINFSWHPGKRKVMQ